MKYVKDFFIVLIVPKIKRIKMGSTSTNLNFIRSPILILILSTVVFFFYVYDWQSVPMVSEMKRTKINVILSFYMRMCSLYPIYSALSLK